MRLILLLLAVFVRNGQSSIRADMTNAHTWSGNFEGHFSFPINKPLLGWEAVITFSEPVTSLATYDFDVIKKSPDNKIYIITQKANQQMQSNGDAFNLRVTGQISGTQAPVAHAVLKDLGFGHDGQTLSPVVHSAGTKYDYDDVLMKSILFYEAQRSGKLPANNRITWRADSALKDRGDNGEDLTGGWYDAGDHVKFGFPMAATTTLLTWGLLQYKDAYLHSGQLEFMYECIRWPLEWLLKCHTAPEELYVQVGDGGQDHGFWGRPEDMTMARPAFKITSSKPGSDVAAEYAAAMAAGYLAFKDKDQAFATKLLTHAKQIYAFALKYKGLYSTSVNQAAAYYRSNAYEDDLTWGAAWLYRATRESQYLTEAEKWYLQGEVPAWGQSWDDKNAGNMIMLYNLTGNQKYRQDIETTFNDWMPGGSIPYSPKGMAFRLQWGALRYASNMAFMALLAADEGIHSTEYRKWAKSQIHYAFGDGGRSYVVGFGNNPPQRPHHRSSSCPMMPSPCGWSSMSNPGPNPHILYGALVGGPDGSDTYKDARDNYINNEVACDYNSGFQSAVAGLQFLKQSGTLP